MTLTLSICRHEDRCAVLIPAMSSCQHRFALGVPVESTCKACSFDIQYQGAQTAGKGEPADIRREDNQELLQQVSATFWIWFWGLNSKAHFLPSHDKCGPRVHPGTLSILVLKARADSSCSCRCQGKQWFNNGAVTLAELLFPGHLGKINRLTRSFQALGSFAGTPFRFKGLFNSRGRGFSTTPFIRLVMLHYLALGVAKFRRHETHGSIICRACH